LRYEQVIDAYMAGIERRVAAGEPVARIASVASFFVSRVDAKIDSRLPTASTLRGKVAIANARLAHARYLDRFGEDSSVADRRWLALRDHGARPRRPLWASTGTKDPAYLDVLYVEKLITPGAISTMPEATLHAFADHGDVGNALDVVRASQALLQRAREAGIDLTAITDPLEREGLQAFCDSYDALLSCIEAKAKNARRAGTRATRSRPPGRAA
jgi:transaldolase